MPGPLLVEINKGPDFQIPSAMKFLFLLIGCMFILLLSCKEDEETCESLRADLIEFKVSEVKNELDSWLGELLPDQEDPDVHLHNLQSFIHRLENDCMLEGSIVCFACIETYPPQSEIRIIVDSAGHQTHRILDVLTPSDSVMTIQNIHL
jgi:hypothetical protein